MISFYLNHCMYTLNEKFGDKTVTNYKYKTKRQKKIKSQQASERLDKCQ